MTRALIFLAAICLLVGCPNDNRPDDAGDIMTDGSLADGAMIDSGGMPGPRPSKRSDFWAIGNPTSGQILVFGGDDGPIIDQIPRASYLDETWVFTPGSGWNQVTTGAQPSHRGRYGHAFDAMNQRAIIFGGRYRVTGGSGDYTLYNDLWAYDFATETWEMLHDGSGTAPPPRYFAGAAVDPSTGTIYVAGGGLNANALAADPVDDLWAFDGTSWTETTTSGATPELRLFVAFAHDTVRSRLIAFAGQTGDFVSLPFNDLHALDLETGVWSMLDDGFGAVAPPGRFNGMLAYDATRDRYIAFAGHLDFYTGNDAWAYDVGGAAWSELSAGDTTTGNPLGCLGNPREIPANFLSEDVATPQGRQTGGFVIMGDTAFSLLGESDCSDHLDDVWALDLTTNAWSEMLEATAGESCLRRGDSCMCLCL